MSWTKKHFQTTALILRSQLPERSGRKWSKDKEHAVYDVIASLVDEFTNTFEKLNPNFSPSRFEDAVYEERN